MAYLSLYRKWRPQRFEDVVGQAHVVRTLVNALDASRVAHAYLFCGPRGTGKTTVARLLAKGLNCEKGPTGRLCNACDNCRRITEGSSLDVIEIDGASNRGIDEIREIRERVHYAPAQASHKVYIVDEVHMLTQEAFNALLKMLEEPPRHVVFIFATTEAHKVPATILSRCQKFDFRRFTPSDLVHQLRRVLEGEGLQYEAEALEWIARHAEGGMRDALAILDQCIAYDPEGVRMATVQEVLGTAPREKLRALIDALSEGDAAAAFSVIHEVEGAMGDLRQFVRDTVAYLRDLMIFETAGQDATQLVALPESEVEAAKAQAKRLGVRPILQAIELLNQAEADMRWSPTPVLTLEMAVVRFIHPEVTTTVAVDAAPAVQGAMPGGQASAAAQPATKPADTPAEGAQVSRAASASRPTSAGAPTGRAQASGGAGAPGPTPGAPAETADTPRAKQNGVQPPHSGARETKPSPGEATPSRSSSARPQEGPVFPEWERLLEQLRAERQRQVEAFLREGTPAEYTNERLLVRFPENRSFHHANISNPENRQVVERALSRMLGRTINLEVVLGGEDVPAEASGTLERTTPAAPVAEESALRSEVSTHPNEDTHDQEPPAVREALELFGGTIVRKREEDS